MDDLEGKATELMGHLGALARRYLFQDKPNSKQEVPLPRQEIRVLLTVGEAGNAAMGQVARELALSGSALTAIADRLIRKGFLHRSRCVEDRRVVRLELTDKGRRFHERRRQARLRMATAMLRTLNDRDQDEFIDFMRRIRAAATDDTGAMPRPRRIPARTKDPHP